MNKISEKQQNMRSLVDFLHEGVVSVHFRKKDGSTRVMKCTLNGKRIPESKHPKGTGKASNSGVLPVFDLEKHEWRSFRVDSVEKYEVL